MVMAVPENGIPLHCQENSVLREFQKFALILNAAPPDLAGSLAGLMALISDNWRRCANVFGGRIGGILSSWISHESVARAAGTGIS